VRIRWIAGGENARRSFCGTRLPECATATTVRHASALGIEIDTPADYHGVLPEIPEQSFEQLKEMLEQEFFTRAHLDHA
jgi:hypothetical protein